MEFSRERIDFPGASLLIGWGKRGGLVMDAEDLLHIRTWGDFSLHPAGTCAFVVESGLDGEANHAQSWIVRWTWNTEGWTADRRFTSGPKDSHPVVSPDGRQLAFLRSLDGGPRQLWIMAINGGEARQTTHLAYGVKDFAWHPKSDRVALIAPLNHGLVEFEDKGDKKSSARFTGDVRIIDKQYYKLDGSGFFGPETDQLILLDVTSGRLDVLSGGTVAYGTPQFSPDGQYLHYLRSNPESSGHHPGERDLWVLELAQGTQRRLTDWHWHLEDYRLSPDGSGIVLVATKPEDMGYGNAELWYFSQGHRQSLSGELDRPIGDGSATDIPVSGPTRPLFAVDGQTVFALVSAEGAVQLWQFAIDGSGGRVVTTGQHVLYGFDCQADHWLLGIADASHPSGLVGWTDGRLTDPRWAPLPWNEESVPKPEELWVKSPDGTPVQSWILKPKISGSLPTILEIHGGPMMMYGWRYIFEFHWLTSQGYAVVFSNPRGSVGYGKRFCSQIIGQWGDRDYADVIAALDGALAHDPSLDPARLGVAGGSYGGFMVNWIVGHSTRFVAAITMRSVVNRFSAMGSSDLGWLRIPQYGVKPWWEDPEPYWQQSPLRYASNIHTPLLIEHQAEDQRLPIEQSEQLYSALKYLGRETRLVVYPGESHGMSRIGKPWHRIHRLRTHAAWWRRYLAAH